MNWFKPISAARLRVRESPEFAEAQSRCCASAYSRAARNGLGATMNEQPALPELVCPAGSLRALQAAVGAGADAVVMLEETVQ